MGIIEIIIIVAVVIIDIATKVITSRLPLQGISLIDGVLHFVPVRNEGASFGILQGQRWLFIALTSVSVIAFLFWMIKCKKAHKLARIAVCLIVGGAIGNLFDRIVYGYVRDFIYFALIDFPVFNIADSALTIGVALLMYYVIFIYKEPIKEVKPDQDVAGEADDGTQL